MAKSTTSSSTIASMKNYKQQKQYEKIQLKSELIYAYIKEKL